MTAIRARAARHAHRLFLVCAFLVVVVLTVPGHAAGPQGFGSSLIPCTPNLCGVFFVFPPDPLTKGEASTNIGGPQAKLKVKIEGAAPLVTYDVRMLTESMGPPFGMVVGTLSTDLNGDGSGTYIMPQDTYLTGVQLWRDSDGGCAILPFPAPPPPGCTDPRIVTGFVVGP